MSEEVKKPVPRYALFLYAAVIFSVAFLLVFLSYLSQEHNRRAFDDEGQQTFSEGQSLEQIIAENERLTGLLELLLIDPAADPDGYRAALGALDRGALPEGAAREVYDRLAGAAP